MFTPRASASTSSGCAYSRSIRSRTRRSSARSRRCCAAAGLLITSRSCHVAIGVAQRRCGPPIHPVPALPRVLQVPGHRARRGGACALSGCVPVTRRCSRPRHPLARPRRQSGPTASVRTQASSSESARSMVTASDAALSSSGHSWSTHDESRRRPAAARLRPQRVVGRLHDRGPEEDHGRRGPAEQVKERIHGNPRPEEDAPRRPAARVLPRWPRAAGSAVPRRYRQHHPAPTGHAGSVRLRQRTQLSLTSSSLARCSESTPMEPPLQRSLMRRGAGASTLVQALIRSLSRVTRW